MAGLGKRRPSRARSGVSGLSQTRQSAGGSHAGQAEGSSELTIQGLAHDGRGISRHANGKTVFVEGAAAGERVRASVHVSRKRFDEAHVTEVIEAAPSRVVPPCPHYAQCGGCDLQHLSVAAQRAHKIEVLRELMARQGVELPDQVAMLAAQSEDYRRRARIGVRVDGQGQVRMGFRARHSHRLVDLQRCIVMRPELSHLLPSLREQLNRLDAPRHVGHLELLATDQATTLVIRQLREHAADLQHWRDFAEHHGLFMGLWLGRETPRFEWLGEAPELSCELAVGARSLRLTLEPGDFLQANEAVNQCMVEQVLDWLAPLDESARVLDLFAGIGNFSLPLAAAGVSVTAVEGQPAMVERLALNAARNGLKVAARQADLSDPSACERLLCEVRPNVVVLDPPRSGAEAVCEQLALRPVEQVLYIACDPATMARDVARLVGAGYEIRRAAVADMFAHTSHLESMLLLEHPDSVRRRQGASNDG